MAGALRILLVTQMWPTAADPDLGSFLVPLVRELRALGHEVEVCAVARRGGPPTKYLRLAVAAGRAARGARPRGAFSHFLFPAGGVGAVARRGGPPTKYLRLAVAAVRAARRARPDVVFAHFLFPAGAAGLA